jgi:hypothetical protein
MARSLANPSVLFQLCVTARLAHRRIGRRWGLMRSAPTITMGGTQLEARLVIRAAQSNQKLPTAGSRTPPREYALTQTNRHFSGLGTIPGISNSTGRSTRTSLRFVPSSPDETRLTTPAPAVLSRPSRSELLHPSPRP